MAMELVTGHAGAAHVSGADVGAFNAKTIGNATYILDAELPTLTMEDANTLIIPVCEILAEGRHVRITAPETVTIESGSQTGYRNDIVFLRYTLEPTTSIETIELVPVTGTTVASQSDVVDPTTEYSSASILDGAATVDIPFARIRLAGLTPTPEWVIEYQNNVNSAFSRLNTIEATTSNVAIKIGNCHIYSGTLTQDVGSGTHYEATIWQSSVFNSTFHCTNAGQAQVFFVNGDAGAGGSTSSYGGGVWGAEFWSQGSYMGWHVRFQSGVTGNRRIDYLVIVPDEYSTV